MYSLVIISFAFNAALAAPVDNYKEQHYVAGHDVMVHLFEWKWKDIGDECERFLGPMGFGGVQVSPITENVIIPSRPWWERYQPVSYQFITRSGNETEFREMVKRCNSAGVRIYVDAVINHMSGDHPFEVIGTGNTWADPLSRNYSKIPYSKIDFHEVCNIEDYCDPVQLRNCELVGLHDLDQGIDNVKSRILEFMNQAIDAGVAGFRIDAAKHMWPSHLRSIYSELNNLNTAHGFRPNSRPYIYQEVIDMGGEAVSKKEYSFAAVTEFVYGLEVTRSMTGVTKLKWLKNIGEEWSMLPHDTSLVFIDNHDNQRGHGGGGSVLNHKRRKLYVMANAFMLAHPYGHPQVMSSFAFNHTDQGPPTDENENIISPKFKDDNTCESEWICEHRWRQIYNMVKFRNTVNSTGITNWWDNYKNQIAFSRGNAGFIAINADEVDLKEYLDTGLPPGIYCDVISGDVVDGRCSGKSVVVDKYGWADIEILLEEEDGVVAIHKNAKL